MDSNRQCGCEPAVLSCSRSRSSGRSLRLNNGTLLIAYLSAFYKQQRQRAGLGASECLNRRVSSQFCWAAPFCREIVQISFNQPSAQMIAHPVRVDFATSLQHHYLCSGNSLVQWASLKRGETTRHRAGKIPSPTVKRERSHPDQDDSIIPQRIVRVTQM